MVQISNRQKLLKRTLQFLISMSLVSLFLCFSWYQNSSFNLVYHLFPFFSHTLERKYMFLICNGILAILAKSSVSGGSFSSEDVVTQPLTSDFYASKPATTDEEVAAEIYIEESLEDVALVGQEDEQQQEENSIVALSEEVAEEAEQEEENEENESLLYLAEDENGAFMDEQQQEEKSVVDLIEVVEEAEEEEGEAVIESNEELTSTEELNRRFEEFIRKMKEEIRIEAQSQLIAV